MFFKIISLISDVQAIASGKRIREAALVTETHGGYRWRKVKGTAVFELAGGRMCHAELHWYEAHGIGARE